MLPPPLVLTAIAALFLGAGLLDGTRRAGLRLAGTLMLVPAALVGATAVLTCPMGPATEACLSLVAAASLGIVGAGAVATTLQPELRTLLAPWRAGLGVACVAVGGAVWWLI